MMPSSAVCLLLAVGAAVGAPTTGDLETACAAQEANQGCCTYCGYEATVAGSDTLCMPSARTAPFPFTITEEDQVEYCQMVATNHGCNDICGYKWDSVLGRCTKAAPTPAPAAGVSAEDKPIIGGQGKYKYQYMPDLLKVRCRASSSSVRIGAGARLVGARG